MATKDYKAIAASKIRKPGQRPPRILVYGRNKQGKTTFCATAPNVLIIDPEGGADYADSNVDIWPIHEWADLNEVFQFLRTGSHKYEWIALDGLTRISNMSLRFVMQQQEERDLDRIPGMVQQRDYGKSGELMKGMLYNFHALPYGIIYTAQDRMETSHLPDVDDDDDVEDVEARFVPDLPKGVRSNVNAIVDVIARIYTVTVEGTNSKGQEIKGRQRRLWVAPCEQYDTGYRSKNRLPNFVKSPSVPKLIEMIKEK